MKYLPTPLNFLVLFLIYSIIRNWPPQREGELFLVIAIPVIIGSIMVDVLLRLLINKYVWIFITETAIIILLYRMIQDG